MTWLTLVGKSRFTREGTKTLRNAIAMPISAVPAQMKPGTGKERSTMPKARISRDIHSARSRPRREAKPGATGEKTAKAKSGRPVRNPAAALENSRSLLMFASTDPTLTKDTRRLTAMSSTPMKARPNLTVRSGAFRVTTGMIRSSTVQEIRSARSAQPIPALPADNRKAASTGAPITGKVPKTLWTTGSHAGKGE
ncbi:hypothetical protein [Pseudarthrobacter sp. GA104]|uniref:hypothetical protein n=1 Tax=Pseudarthrobacter sp. GA104 TaxID=2676311 RepID=UPI001E2A7A28|nr:hypothetical protein [Pseudarthrobacter sp. GA104]